MLTLRIALRYLVAPKSNNAVNVISLISMGGVAVATAAIIIVLSVFNGFNDLAYRHLSILDPELKIVATTGKAFEKADSLGEALLKAVPEIETLSPVIEERGLIVNGNRQMPVRFKAVNPEEYPSVVDYHSSIIDGIGIDDLDSTAMTVSIGTSLETGLRPSPETRAELYVPRRVGKINPANPAASYRSESMIVAGVFQVDQAEYDTDIIIIPLESGRSLLQYFNGEATAFELKTRGTQPQTKTIRQIQDFLGEGFRVETRMQQQATAYHMIAIEKWLTFALLAAILVIAAFNIVSTLSLLVIEKRGDVQTLHALGATGGMTRSIFQWEGAFITVTGGIIGIILGSLLTLGQQYFGWIKLSGDSSMLTTESYPVRLAFWPDIAATLGAIIALAVAISLIARLFTRSSRP